VIDVQSEAYFVAFHSAADCISVAVEAQRALRAHEWPEGDAVLVRMGNHTGEVELNGERYLGMAVHRAARIGNAGHGGQVLLSDVGDHSRKYGFGTSLNPSFRPSVTV
jgi:class 3 adenylate cyclase